MTVAGACAGTLVVDLDGTLLRTDLIYESFWSALSADPAGALAALPALARGRAALKAALAGRAALDPADLPYNENVLALVQDWRAKGGQTALVTASDRRLAEAVAGHLGLFDEVHASDGALNLKGEAKAALLARRFADGYDYVGDATADLPAWRGARRAVTVGAPAALRRAVEALPAEVLHLPAPRPRPADYLRAMRPHQWLKNLLIFIPAFAAHDLSAATLLVAAIAFVAFSMVASGIYIVNDLLDLAADRAHPRKRLRPLASGAVPLLHGTVMAPLLVCLGLLTGLATGRVLFVGILAGYIVLTSAYSLWLKRRAIMDICTLAGLYTIRILAGGVAAGVWVSEWLLAFSIFIFVALAAVKRQAELVDGLSSGRREAAGRGYCVEDLPIVSMIAISAGYVAVLVVALYVDSPAVRALYHTPAVLWGICPVLLYWVSRTVMIAHRGGMHDDPIVFAVRDRVSIACGALIAALVLGASL